jgi:dihydroneopterin triphosphate diphosphatase
MSAVLPDMLGARPLRIRGVHREVEVAEVSVGTVDVYVIRPLPEGWRVLVLQRAASGTRCPLAWETVHGRLEAGETPEQGAERELAEETGLRAERLYSITVQPFYMPAMLTVQLAVVFAAFVATGADEVALGPEHGRAEWLTVAEALDRFVWPRERDALREIAHLLRAGDAGPVEDVLRVR